MALISVDDVRAAAGSIAGRAVRTPLLPLGPDFWVDTVVTLPPEAGVAAGTRFRNVFTDETITTEGGERGPHLAAEKIFTSFPVALLERAA